MASRQPLGVCLPAQAYQWKCCLEAIYAVHEVYVCRENSPCSCRRSAKLTTRGMYGRWVGEFHLACWSGGCEFLVLAGE
ncbi:hypothetical protein I7I48_12133 [Histoplasma ohiense]|nr:hypothetical protein I7I48_12133 [Histoplasma ohiense (nom. inval.)]